MSPRRLLLPALLLLALLVGQVGPAWRARFADTRDYASFHYAVRVWRAGGDPYDGAALVAAARADGRGGEVYPFLYPPPALPLLAPFAGGGLRAGYAAMMAANAAAALGLGLVLARWFRPPPLLLAALLAAWTPLGWSLRMGQVNALVLLPLVLGLAAGRGAPLGLAAVIKVAPALPAARWLWPWRPRPLLGALGAVLLAHALALPWVPLALQRHFYAEVLPGLATGAWNGLEVPIALPANHAIANLLDQLWPGPDPHRLSPAAAWGTRALVGGAALGLLVRGRRPGDALAEANLAGAWLALMTLAPVYTWEHHLVFLLPGAVAAATAAWTGRLPRGAWVALLPCLFALVLPLDEFRRLQRVLPDLAVAVRESKLVGAVGLGLVNAWAARAARA